MASALVPESDQRLGDYLDDKLQTLADLESLDSLLFNVRNQQSLLRQQLEDAQQDLQEARKASQEHATTLRTRQHDLSKESADIDRRLKDITGAAMADEASRKFEASVEKLNKLQAAKGYVDLVKEVDRLR
jgi:chromosome segregation ATPase